ncbi:prolipoprotein diacylglyceryltransferase [Arthrobacter sp. UYCu712]
MNTPIVAELFLPSPAVSAFSLGPLTIRFYALCILVGVWLTARRLRARGGTTSQTLDIVTWAVPFGILGGRLYH